MPMHQAEVPLTMSGSQRSALFGGAELQQRRSDLSVGEPRVARGAPSEISASNTTNRSIAGRPPPPSWTGHVIPSHPCAASSREKSRRRPDQPGVLPDLALPGGCRPDRPGLVGQGQEFLADREVDPRAPDDGHGPTSCQLRSVTCEPSCSESYGGPEVLTLADVPEPEPGPEEVLVDVVRHRRQSGRPAAADGVLSRPGRAATTRSRHGVRRDRRWRRGPGLRGRPSAIG